MKSKILELRKSGLSYRKIAKKLGTTVWQVEYWSNPKRRKIQKIAQTKYRLTNPVQKKVAAFHELTKRRRGVSCGSNFTYREFLTKIGPNPKCYITGSAIDLTVPEAYSIDHIVPISKGGDNSIDNAGIIRRDVNEVKGGNTLPQLVQICIEILEANGYEVSG